ncbi:MAG: adenosine kinase [bacterium]|nr:adenosine kinase [bacterium]
MKTIQLTGVGNALVDLEVQVSDAEFASFGLTKSTMALTSPERQREMIESLAGKTIHRSSGGSAANSIIAFAQFGGKGAYNSLLGADQLGSFYAEEFSELGINLHARHIAGESTGTCLVMITPDTERTLNTTLAVNTAFTRKDLDEQQIRTSEWIYIEGYKLTEEGGADAVENAAFLAKKHGTHVAVSCSDKFIIDVFGDRLRALLKHADLVFCNESEATTLSGESNGNAAFEALGSIYRNVAVTMGEQGSSVQWNGEQVQIPAYAVTPVDATGAGDMFAGAFFYGVLNRYRAEHAGRLASYAASLVVAQLGARLKSSHLEVRDAVLSTAETII